MYSVDICVGLWQTQTIEEFELFLFISILRSTGMIQSWHFFCILLYAFKFRCPLQRSMPHCYVLCQNGYHEEASQSSKKKKEKRKKRAHNKSPSGSFYVSVFDFVKTWTLSKKVLLLHSGMKKSWLTLSTFISFIYFSHFQDDRTVCESLPDTRSLMRLFGTLLWWHVLYLLWWGGGDSQFPFFIRMLFQFWRSVYS